MGKIIFADQLRAVAIILVIISHWCGVFWYMREIISAYTYSPMIEGPPSRILSYLSIPTVNYGPLGVAIFFLISGFVIPISLRKNNPFKFLIARFLRIYPAYIFAVLITVFCIYLSTVYWNREYKLDLSYIFWNILLLNENVGVPSIDLINWSLAIEIKFYILAAMLYSSIRNSNPVPSLIFALITFCFIQMKPDLFIHLGFSQVLISSLKTQFLYIVYMFIGVCFYNHYIGAFSLKKLITYTSIFGTIFCLCWLYSDLSSSFRHVTINYLYGFIIFSCCYFLRDKFKKNIFLDFFATISYSIYIYHSIIGYILLRILMDNGFKFYIAIVITLIIVIFISYLSNVIIEKPTIRLGKKISYKKI